VLFVFERHRWWNTRNLIQVLRGRAPRIKFKTIKHDTTDEH